jgi:hypothetical protein
MQKRSEKPQDRFRKLGSGKINIPTLQNTEGRRAIKREKQ